MATAKRPHAVLVSSPGLGHLIPILEFGQRLAGDHGVQVTLLAVAAEAAPVESKLQSLLCNKNDLLHVEVIEPESINSKLPPEIDMVTRIFATVRESLPIVRSRILGMETRPTALIVDLFVTEYYSIADELEIPKYAFMFTSAWATAFFVYSSVLKKEVSIDEIESTGLIPIPGCASMRIVDIFKGGHPSSPGHSKVAHSGSTLAAADGLVVNSWEELEPATLNSFRDPKLLGSIMKGPVYPIGPLVRAPNMSDINDEVLHWLNEQPDESVLFISFGSGGALTYDQIQEMALGLEASKHKFLWVLRPPTAKNASQYYFNADVKDQNDPASWLPDGFLTRTKEFGRVVTTWAPQLEILSHPSIGGFLSHVGWNSVSESIVHGVPMITWPLYAEQLMIETMVSAQLKIGVSPSKRPEEGTIGRDEIQKLVEVVMDGESSVRRTAKEFKLSATKALEKTENSSAYKTMCEFVRVLRNKM